MAGGTWCSGRVSGVGGAPPGALGAGCGAQGGASSPHRTTHWSRPRHGWLVPCGSPDMARRLSAGVRWPARRGVAEGGTHEERCGAMAGGAGRSCRASGAGGAPPGALGSGCCAQGATHSPPPNNALEPTAPRVACPLRQSVHGAAAHCGRSALRAGGKPPRQGGITTTPRPGTTTTATGDDRRPRRARQGRQTRQTSQTTTTGSDRRPRQKPHARDGPHRLAWPARPTPIPASRVLGHRVSRGRVRAACQCGAEQTLAPDAGEWGSVAGDYVGGPGAGEARR